MNVHFQQSSLPSQPTPFIGREEDLSRISAMLAEPSCRLVSLVGPGGIGKTRLATQAALHVQPMFADGVYFFNLQPVSSTAFLASALADALKLTLHGRDDPFVQLLHYLEAKTCLLLLDNFEHLLDSVDLLVAMLDAAPGVKMLVTSREVLNLRQEWVWPVTGMAFPDNERSESPEKYSAVRLFAECARRVRPDFLLSKECEAVIRTCRLVEGMPLAIELASSWLKLLPCADIADEVKRGLDFLNTSLRDIPERHRSMRAVFDHSWKLLNTQEQAAFRRLSVFRGGFQREAAERVAGASLAVLSALVDKSLIWRDANGRYQMHELLRQYAEEQLTLNAEEAGATFRAHVAYYTHFLRRQEWALHSQRQRDTLQALDAEIDNIRAGWQRAIATGDIAAIQLAAFAYYDFNDMRGRYQEGLDAATQAVEHLQSLEDSEARDFTLAILHNIVGCISIRLGRFDAARAAYSASVRLYRQLDRRPLPGFGTHPLMGMGLWATTIGDYGEAVRLVEEALQQIETTDSLNRMFALYVLATATYSQERYETAFEYAQQSYQISREEGDDWFSAYVLVVMGDIAWAVEDYDRAWTYYQTSYRLKENFNEQGGMAFALNRLGCMAWIQGNFPEAERLYRRGYDLYREVNDPGGLGMSLFGLGDTAQAQGDYETAQGYFQQALDIAMQIRWPQLILSILVGVGDMLLRTGEREQAVELLTLVAQHPAAEPPARKRAQWLLGAAPTVTAAGLPDLPGLVESVRDLLKRPRTNAGHTTRLQQGLMEPLSERELEILRLLADGLTNEEIAERLTLVVGTVKAHNHHIFGKLGVKNRVQAVGRARELGLL